MPKAVREESIGSSTIVEKLLQLGRVHLVGSGIINPEGVFVQVGLGKIK